MMQGVYALIDPHTQEVRYIGRSVNIEARYRDHLNKCDKRPYWSARWIRSLKELGLEPQLEILEQVEDRNTLKDREMAWIAYAHEQGWNLTNLTDGGDGTLNPSEHPRQAIAEANRKRKFTDEMRARISETSKGRRHSAETIERCRVAAQKPRGPLSDEHKAKLSALKAGITLSDDHRRKISEGQMGHVLSDEAKDKLRRINIGKTLSDEHRAKISASRKGQKPSPEAARNQRAALNRPEVKEKLRQAARNRKRQKE